METTLGGERLGSGKKQKIYGREYERSTHDLGYAWRSSMSSGTLVPFMKELALPGDTFEINLNCEVMTLPTIGPLFGSYKVQLDVFTIPIRLYNSKLMQNTLNVGMNMKDVLLPQLKLTANSPTEDSDLDNSQINPSSIFSYLDIRGLGVSRTQSVSLQVSRDFNALPYLMYWDIYKNYYANKQEEIGAVIHTDVSAQTFEITSVVLTAANGVFTIPENNTVGQGVDVAANYATKLVITFSEIGNFDADKLLLWSGTGNGEYAGIPITEIWKKSVLNVDEQTITFTESVWQNYFGQVILESQIIGKLIAGYRYDEFGDLGRNIRPNIVTFPLENIDKMRDDIMKNDSVIIGYDVQPNYMYAPYSLAIQRESVGVGTDPDRYSKEYSQEGLALKTYQSDLFNNWISTEWIDGDNGVNAITSIDTSEGSFTIDTLNLSRKIYDMLNRIALSGGSYDDWLDATYTHERTREVQNPVYVGGLSKELIFQEVISTTETESNPLGTLAGKGRLSGKNKGGYVKVRIDEPSYIMGIVSLTPRIDYSQGNKWDVNLKTMDDFHKPALDEIGFQDLITDQMAWWDTDFNLGTGLTFKSAGKQPAWINYMTNVNKVGGNFAVENKEMFMTLNRRYEAEWEDNRNPQILDLTTYVDPSKFNNIFADTRIDAQNFWVQIGIDIEARRKMSAKVIPNL